ncbi:hypothetical protein P171DRAFT_151519 [Karstenula rhodostoma CBS 690.94]|uniref:Uncharacterized protein n=1 Tax=Karstenula rhodostoma CBS 690.94 TaxID=1392251 RepID=A0A9P4PV82_9PLEO|nr:hypothetical protein P171DRAFT_151519 [Karstenula rhodostoma CBS 690.94]
MRVSRKAIDKCGRGRFACVGLAFYDRVSRWRAEQDKTRQDKTRQDKTRQAKPSAYRDAYPSHQRRRMPKRTAGPRHASRHASIHPDEPGHAQAAVHLHRAPQRRSHLGAENPRPAAAAAAAAAPSQRSVPKNNTRVLERLDDQRCWSPSWRKVQSCCRVKGGQRRASGVCART